MLKSETVSIAQAEKCPDGSFLTIFDFRVLIFFFPCSGTQPDKSVSFGDLKKITFALQPLQMNAVCAQQASFLCRLPHNHVSILPRRTRHYHGLRRHKSGIAFYYRSCRLIPYDVKIRYGYHSQDCCVRLTATGIVRSRGGLARRSQSARIRKYDEALSGMSGPVSLMRGPSALDIVEF